MARTRIPLNAAEGRAESLAGRLDLSTAEIGLTVRTTNCLEEKGIFTVRDLLQLATGSIVASENANGADVPVVVNTKLIGWAEFEVVGQKLAVRITELT